MLEILEAMDKPVKTVYNEARESDVRHVILDNLKIRGIYKGRVLTFEEGLQKYCRYLESVTEGQSR